MNKTLTAALATSAGLLAAGLVTLAAPAQATTPQVPCPTTVPATVDALTVPTCPPKRIPALCADWQAHGATGTYPDVSFGDKPAGTKIGDTWAKLTKPAEGVDPGVEFAARDLDLEFDEATTVSVKYKLSDGASSASGAIRMFGYAAANADTLTKPDWEAIADGNAGTLSFTIPAGGKLGTLGLVYDASNDSKGAVTFAWLKIGKKLMKFTPCPKPTTTTTAPTTTAPTTPPQTTAPTTAPTTPPTASPTTTSTEAPPPPIGGSAGGLPVTGPGIGILAAAAGAMIAIGAIVVYGARKRRQFMA